MIDQFRNFTTYKIDPLAEIRNAGIITNGSVFWVKDTADADYSTFRDQVGGEVMSSTVDGGINLTQDDRNDYVFIIPRDNNAAYDITAKVEVDNDRVHLLGVGQNKSAHGYKTTIRGYSTGAAFGTTLMEVTGAGVEIGNLRLLGTTGTHANGTISAGLLRFGTGSTGTPHMAWLHDVTVENTQAAAAGGTVDLVTVNGNVATGITGMRFDDCWIGNWSWEPAALIRMGGTAGPTRLEVYNTTFVTSAQATTAQLVVCGTGQTEYAIFDRCRFINVNEGTAPASALTGAVLAGNPVLMYDCSYVAISQAGTDTQVYKAPALSGTAATVRDYGIAIGTAAVSPS